MVCGSVSSKLVFCCCNVQCLVESPAVYNCLMVDAGLAFLQVKFSVPKGKNDFFNWEIISRLEKAENPLFSSLKRRIKTGITL